MRVRYIHESPLSGGGKQCSNIMWEKEGSWRMTEGDFPKEHPSVKFAAQLERFRSRGYAVSSFPEGDGFTLDLKQEQTREQVERDIQECFGWELSSP